MKITLSSLLAFVLALGAVAQDKMAFLGVASRQADQAVTDVLGLPAGIGLIVESVEPKSAAAAAGIQQHDLLHKFDDQLLTSPRQLAVLVRSKKVGEKVELDYLRKGKAQTADVQLGETPFTELPEVAQNFGFQLEPPQVELFFNKGGMKDLEKRLAEAQKKMEKDLAQRLNGVEAFGLEFEKMFEDLANNKGPELNRAAEQLQERLQNQFNQGDIGEALGGLEFNLGQMFENGQLGQAFAIGRNGSVESSITENGKTFTFKQENDKKNYKVEENGKALFDGPVNTEAERAKVPEDLVAKLKQMEKNTKVGGNAGVLNFDFQFGGPFDLNMNRNQQKKQQLNKEDKKASTQDGIVSIIEDDLTVSISERDGKQHCKALDGDGKVLFDGPIVSAADQAMIPKAVRSLLDDMNALPDPQEAPVAEVEDEEEL